MALSLDVGYGAQIQHVARRIFKRTHAALTQHHVGIALRQNVLCRHQQVFDCGAHAALEQHRLACLADFTQQVEVLHVASANLKHIGVAKDHIDLPRVHDFGDDRQSVAMANLCENLQAGFAKSLKAVRTGTRLKGAAAKKIRSCGLDMAGNRFQDFGAFDGARSGDQHQRAAADTHRLDRRTAFGADRDDGVLTAKFAAGQLERLEDRQNLFDAGNGRQRFGPQFVLFADDANDGALLALTEVRSKSQLADAIENVLDLRFSRIGSENDNHHSTQSTTNPTNKRPKANRRKTMEVVAYFVFLLSFLSLVFSLGVFCFV